MRTIGIAVGSLALLVSLGSMPGEVCAGGGRSNNGYKGQGGYKGHGGGRSFNGHHHHGFKKSFARQSFVTYVPSFLYPSTFYEPFAYSAPFPSYPPVYAGYSPPPGYGTLPEPPPPVYPVAADVTPPAPPPPPEPTVVRYANGRYELRGDGTATPHQWVWVPNPPPPPKSSEESVFYTWVDERGILHVTNQWSSVPQRYREEAKRNASS